MVEFLFWWWMAWIWIGVLGGIGYGVFVLWLLLRKPDGND